MYRDKLRSTNYQPLFLLCVSAAAAVLLLMLPSCFKLESRGKQNKYIAQKEQVHVQNRSRCRQNSLQMRGFSATAKKRRSYFCYCCTAVVLATVLIGNKWPVAHMSHWVNDIAKTMSKITRNTFRGWEKVEKLHGIPPGWLSNATPWAPPKDGPGYSVKTREMCGVFRIHRPERKPGYFPLLFLLWLSSVPARL